MLSNATKSLIPLERKYLKHRPCSHMYAAVESLLPFLLSPIVVSPVIRASNSFFFVDTRSYGLALYAYGFVTRVYRMCVWVWYFFFSIRVPRCGLIRIRYSSIALPNTCTKIAEFSLSIMSSNHAHYVWYSRVCMKLGWNKLTGSSSVLQNMCTQHFLCSFVSTSTMECMIFNVLRMQQQFYRLRNMFNLRVFNA